MRTLVKLNNTDVTEDILSWDLEITDGNAIDECSLVFSFTIRDLLTISYGDYITIQRGIDEPDEEYVFRGTVVVVEDEASRITVTCKNPLYDAQKTSRSKLWDKNIDPQQGIGSEIFKDICDHCKVKYTEESIQSTGTEDDDLITQFIQNDDDDFTKMQELAELYGFIIFYDYEQNIVYFREKFFTNYPRPLKVGSEIPNQIKWTTDGEGLIAELLLYGATVFDRITEQFAGPGFIFDLQFIPEDTEVRVNHSTTNDLLKRGHRDYGDPETFDYYIDEDNKKLFLNEAASDVWINYGAQVPMPLLFRNNDVIELYSGVNEVPHKRRINFQDKKNIEDAEKIGKQILKDNSVPFANAEDIQIDDDTRIKHGNLLPGILVEISDEYNNIQHTLSVSAVRKVYPHINDRITVGDRTWRTEDLQVVQARKINSLYNQLNRNRDILMHIIQYEPELKLEPRYLYIEKDVRAYFDSFEEDFDGWETFFIGVGNEPQRSSSFATHGSWSLLLDGAASKKEINFANVKFLIFDVFISNNPEAIKIGWGINEWQEMETELWNAENLSVGVHENIIIDLESIGGINYLILKADIVPQNNGVAFFDNLRFYSAEKKPHYLQQGNNNYFELLYDEEFFDEVKSDPEVSWGSIYDDIVIPPQKTAYTKTIELNTNRNDITIDLGPTFNSVYLKLEITHNNSDWIEFENLEEVIFPEPSTDIRLRITNTYDD